MQAARQIDEDYTKLSRAEIGGLVDALTQAEIEGDIGEVERLSALLDRIHRARVAAGLETE